MRLQRALIFSTLVLALASPVDAKATRTPQWLITHLRAEYRDSPDHNALQFGFALVDLDADGKDEIVVYVAGGTRNCGTGGCGIEVLARTGRGWRTVSQTSIGWSPIRLLPDKSHGWRDIGVVVAGGGIIPGYEARLRFNGKRYPFNPSVPPAQRLPRNTRGKTLIKSADRPLF